MKIIDFSPMHNVLIRNRDGSLLPMDQPYYESELAAPGVWKIISDGDCHYLVEGGNEALAIDTGYGAGNLREYLQTLTDKPVKRVANTHYHFDHTANNGYFEAAYMSEESIPLATVPYASFKGIDFITDYPRIAVREGDVIDLGGRCLEVIEIPGHAIGSVAYLDRKNRIMFTGDEVDKFVSLSCSVAGFVENMKKLSALRGEIDVCFGGHGPLNPDCIDKLLALGCDILADRAVESTRNGKPRHKEGPPAPEGAVVYGRQSPRPGDNSGRESRGPRRMVEGYGVRISYDSGNVR